MLVECCLKRLQCVNKGWVKTFVPKIALFEVKQLHKMNPTTILKFVIGLAY
jgi:hypothetical protein